MSEDRRTTASAGASLFVGIFTRNLPTKIAAFILAVLVWFTVRLELMVDKSATMPLELDFEEGLMLAGEPPPDVKVEIEGPRPDIAVFEKSESALVLRVILFDLRGQTSAQLEFGLDNDDLDRFRLSFDSEIRIKRVYVAGGQGPQSIQVAAAVRKEAAVTVLQPKVEGLPKEWEEQIELLTPTVRVEGPADWFATHGEVAPVPISAASILANRQELDEVPISERALALDPALATAFIRFAAGERIRYQGSFRKSKATEDLLVPFKVLFERPEHPFTLTPVPSDILKKGNGGFGVLLTFTGAPSDLEKLKKVIEDDGVHAYVLAEDFAPYRDGTVEEGKKDRGSIRPVRLEINSDIYPDLAERVGFDQPPAGSVDVETMRR